MLRRYASVPVSTALLNQRKNRPLARSLCLPRKIAESAGVSVNALNAEIDTEKAIVNANCRNRIPVVPGKKDTGTNTEIKTREVATTALETSAIAADVAAWGLV